MKTVHALLAGAMLFAGSAFADAVAQEIELPSTVSWTSYDVGSSGYVQAVAIGAALSDAYSTNLRVLPATSDVARVLPVKQGRVDFALLGSESFNAVEGTVAFADPQLGPQQLQMLYGANSDNCFTLALQGDLTVNGPDDLRGKRLGWVVGSPALQANVAAFLAFYGLTWDDVEKVDVPSFAGSWEAFLNGQVDAITTLTTVSFATQAAASPSGLNWLALPASDKEGWEKLRMIKPQFAPRVGTAGANMSKDKSVECAGFPFPVLLAYPDQDEDMIYNLTKAIDLQYDEFVTAEPSLVGWAADRQNFQWNAPYHAGAVRYWKEKGLWTDADTEHNEALIKRQDILQSAWEGLPEGERSEKWSETRTKTLEDAGLPTYN
ncbi:TAXI family TRAP transporter solute-binding subunit [Hoeflea sp. CAU 1731]